ncbi:DUF805 domain-containing protein [Latilactobacillus fuchuensis]|nr:DUF805 domain-containing protein [Latilactobacillus fuchuensis]MCP8857506.1 DUF805 domain-containing protein [Latilactobacillus fuchuensis]
MMYCQNCGQQIKQGIKFCPYCGTQQQVNEPNQQMNGQQAAQNQYHNQAPQGNNQPNNFVNKTQQFQQQFQQFQQQYNGDATNQQQLGFIGSTKYAIAHWNDFKTPESRKSIFWWSELGIMIAFIVIMLIGMVIITISSSLLETLGVVVTLVVYLIYAVLSVLATVLGLSAGVRRLRFLGKEPWLIVLYLVPVVQWYILYLMLIDKPQPQMNQWNQQGYPNQNMGQPNQPQGYQNFNGQQPPMNGNPSGYGYQQPMNGGQTMYQNNEQETTDQPEIKPEQPINPDDRQPNQK